MYDAAYKAAFAAASGGASGDDALQAAHSAAYQSGQSQSSDYLYSNTDGLNGSEMKTSDLGIQRTDGYPQPIAAPTI